MSLIVDGLVNPDCLWCLREGIFSHLKTSPMECTWHTPWRGSVGSACFRGSRPVWRTDPHDLLFGFQPVVLQGVLKCAVTPNKMGLASWRGKLCHRWDVDPGARRQCPRKSNQRDMGPTCPNISLHRSNFPHFSNVNLYPEGGASVHKKTGKGQRH
jgi:hypothetical protein